MNKKWETKIKLRFIEQNKVKITCNRLIRTITTLRDIKISSIKRINNSKNQKINMKLKVSLNFKVRT